MNNVLGNDSAKLADRAASPLYREHFGDGPDADARERVEALFGLSAAAEERDRHKAAEAELPRLKRDE